jgi:hypothetical protein
MIVTSSRMIRNAQRGAAGNQTICAMALSATKKIAGTRAALLPPSSPTPVRAIIDPRIRCNQPQTVMSAMIAPWPPTTTTSSLRIPARPQSALREPTMNSSTPANAAQPE